MAANPSDVDILRAQILGYRATFVLRAAVDLGLADLLRGGPRDVGDIAAQANYNADALGRLLFALVQIGIVVRNADGRYALTPRGACLRSDHPEKLNAFAKYQGHDFIQRPWAHVTQAVRTGSTQFEGVFGTTAFDYLEKNPDVAALFTEGMAAHNEQHVRAIVSAYDWSVFGTLVDIGGADGALLAAILAAAPDARGVIFDQPRVASQAERRIAITDLTKRCRFVGGDFFDSAPPGGDAYILKYILHDWDDARAAAILATVRKAAKADSRLIVIERVVPEDDEPALDTAMLDVAMLVLTGGRERRAAEFAALFDQAGFSLERIIPTDSSFRLIMGAPR